MNADAVLPDVRVPARAARSRHRLSPAQLNELDDRMAFDWRLADRAHPDWLGAWATPMAALADAGPRLRRRVSASLLDRHGLATRPLVIADGDEWMLAPRPHLLAMAQALGVAMLGGWVRNGLERSQVAQQLAVLGVERRAAALRHAASLKALPFSTSGRGWPLARPDLPAVVDLGLSCMAALLADHEGGARERFLMGFPSRAVRSLTLGRTQREEARALIAQTVRDLAGLPGRGGQVPPPDRDRDRAPAQGARP